MKFVNEPTEFTMLIISLAKSYDLFKRVKIISLRGSTFQQ